MTAKIGEFSGLARRYSDDSTSAAQGGNLRKKLKARP
jgi:hypothetical protein